MPPLRSRQPLLRLETPSKSSSLLEALVVCGKLKLTGYQLESAAATTCTSKHISHIDVARRDNRAARHLDHRLRHADNDSADVIHHLDAASLDPTGLRNKRALSREDKGSARIRQTDLSEGRTSTLPHFRALPKLPWHYEHQNASCRHERHALQCQRTLHPHLLLQAVCAADTNSRPVASAS